MIIRGKFRYMAENEIRMMIDPGTISEISRVRRDSHPLFKAFIVGHEGEARGFLVGVGNIVKKWYRSAIQNLFTKIDHGIPLFHGHGETNDQSGRTAIGEVVGKKLETIGDRLSAVVACYIYPQFRNLPLDVASIEADIDFEQKQEGIVVVNVNDVSAIALANRAVETPGFPGATLLGQLQAFAKINHLEEKSMIGLDDVKQFIRESGAKPSDVFDAASLTGDPIVIGFAEERVKTRIGAEYQHRKTTEEALEALKKKHEEDLKTRDERIRNLSQDASKGKIPAIFEKKAAERKFDERQKKFIAARLGKFTPPADEKELEVALDKHLDSEVDEYKVIAKDVFGIADVTAPANGGGTGGEPNNDPNPGAGKKDYADSANSPIPL
jgi:hypothetical protein